MIYLFRKEIKRWHSVLWIVFISVALGGLSSIIVFRYHSPQALSVATVDGDPISFKKFNAELEAARSQITMLRNYARARGIPEDLFLSMEQVRNPQKYALDSCIQQKILERVERGIGIVLDEKIFSDSLIKNLPYHLFDREGKVDEQVYKRYLMGKRLSVTEYEEGVENDLIQQLTTEFIKQAHYLPYRVTHQAHQSDVLRKKFTVTKIPLATFVKRAEKESIPGETLKTYCQKHREAYRVGEKRKASYWNVTAETYLAKTTIDDSVIERFYDRNKSTLYRIPPKVKLRRILIPEADGFSRAQELHAQLIAAPDQFASMAKNHSADKQTSHSGGIVDFFDKGTYDPSFERAAFRLQNVGDISPVVTTKDGFEVLQLIERKPASIKPLAEVREEIASSIKAKKALRLMQHEVKNVMRQAKKNPAELAIFVKQNKFKKQETDWLQKPNGAGNKLTERLAQKVFEQKTSKTGDSGFFAHGDDFVIYQVADVEKSFVPAFSKISSDVEEDYRAQAARSAIKKASQEIRDTFFEKRMPLKEIATTMDLNTETTGFILRNDTSSEKGIPSGVISRAFILSDKNQLFELTQDDVTYLIQLVDTQERKEPISIKETFLLHNDLVEQSEKTYLSGFIASLQSRAKIARNNRILNLDASQNTNF